MSFEDIPEDKIESYPCPECEHGNVIPKVSLIPGWECDTCNFNTEED